jgi:site-specific DNA-methyltransferase (adenine-specific)
MNHLEKQPGLFDALTPPGGRVPGPASKLPTARHLAAFASARDAAPQEIVQADCLAYLPTMPARSVACVVTSPPYNVARPYSSYDDNRPLAEYLAQQESVAREIARVLRTDGHLFLNVGSNSKAPWRSVEVAQVCGRYLPLQQRIVWVESIALDGSTLPRPLREAMHDRQVGHFVSLHSVNYVNPTVEDIWHFSPSGRSPIKPDAEGVGVGYVWADQPEHFGHHRTLHCRGAAWHIPYKTTQSKADRDFHPAPFPVALPERCLRLADLPPGSLVLDPFAGTGATLVAAKALGLAGVGIEIDDSYCAAARRRLGGEYEGNDIGHLPLRSTSDG